MMKKNSFGFVGLLLASSIAGVYAQAPLPDQSLALTEVIFEESEPGIEPYITRLLLSDTVLRLDEGQDQDSKGYILYDRKTREIHSFNHQDKSHLVMKSLPIEPVEFRFDYRVEKIELPDSPLIAGKRPVQHEFVADNRLCKKSINVDGFLPQVTQALIQYEQSLVAQNSQTLSEIPSSVRSGCYMSNNYQHASDYLQAGFPMYVIDDLGRQKKLLSFRQVVKPASLFLILEGYRLYYPNPSNL